MWEDEQQGEDIPTRHPGWRGQVAIGLGGRRHGPWVGLRVGRRLHLVRVLRLRRSWPHRLRAAMLTFKVEASKGEAFKITVPPLATRLTCTADMRFATMGAPQASLSRTCNACSPRHDPGH